MEDFIILVTFVDNIWTPTPGGVMVGAFNRKSHKSGGYTGVTSSHGSAPHYGGWGGHLPAPPKGQHPTSRDTI